MNEVDPVKKKIPVSIEEEKPWSSGQVVVVPYVYNLLANISPYIQ